MSTGAIKINRVFQMMSFLYSKTQKSQETIKWRSTVSQRWTWKHMNLEETLKSSRMNLMHSKMLNKWLKNLLVKDSSCSLEKLWLMLMKRQLKNTKRNCVTKSKKNLRKWKICLMILKTKWRILNHICMLDSVHQLILKKNDFCKSCQKKGCINLLITIKYH